MDTEQLVVQLVEAFGQPESIVEQVAEDCEWTVHIGNMEPGGTHKGKVAIRAVMNKVFGEIYDPATVQITVHSATGNAAVGAVRFNYQCVTTWGAPLNNEYALFAEYKDGEAIRVNEYLDGFAAMEQLGGSDAPG